MLWTVGGNHAPPSELLRETDAQQLRSFFGKHPDQLGALIDVYTTTVLMWFHWCGGPSIVSRNLARMASSGSRRVQHEAPACSSLLRRVTSGVPLWPSPCILVCMDRSLDLDRTNGLPPEVLLSDPKSEEEVRRLFLLRLFLLRWRSWLAS